MGVGGIFLRARNPKALSAWYATHFGITSGEGGSLVFERPSAAGMTVFAHFPAHTKYFGSGTQQVIVNFRVDNLASGCRVTIDPKRDDYPYGRFTWVVDPEGNRVELWQLPADPA